MPYITESRRMAVGPSFEEPAADVGELTYQLTEVVETYRAAHRDRFATFAAIIGALVCTALEFYRRVVAKYEDDKSLQNGDVYEPVSRQRGGTQ